MRAGILAGLIVGAVMAAGAASAQTPPATIGAPYVPAPWWMRDPVIASIGSVRTELPANRASFQVTFVVVQRNVNDAVNQASDRVRDLSQQMGTYGADAVRVETTIRTRPLYEQYRDEAGIIRENARSDQIDRYEATATVNLQVRDVSRLEQIYAAVLDAQPTSVSALSFVLDPGNEVRTELAEAAVRNAARRARSAATAAGASLGPIRVIDPTGRACQTDVLAGWPARGPADVGVEDIVLTASRVPAPPPPPPPPGSDRTRGDVVEARRLVLQPPFQILTEQACVVFSLN